MVNTASALVRTVGRLVEAVNRHDLEALVACFHPDYTNETPTHPRRGFVGREQVRSNWAKLFSGVPDIRARVSRTAVDGPTVWTEWELTGTRHDSTALLMRGVVIFQIPEGPITSATFYLEPVEQVSGDVNTAVGHVVGDPTRTRETT